MSILGETLKIQGSFVRNIPLGMVIINNSGKIIDINELGAAIYRKPRKQLLGQDIRKVVPPLSQPAAWRALQTGQATVFEHSQSSTGHPECVCRIYASPLRDHNDKIIGAMAIFQDITEEKKLQLARLTTKRALLHLRDSILIIDREGKIVFANQYPEEVVGRPYIDVAYDGRKFDAEGKYTSRTIETLETGREYINAIVPAQDGERSFRLDIRRLVDSDGNFLGVVSYRADVTHQMQMKERLKRAELLETVGQIASTTAHELRNPLTAIRAAAQVGTITDNLPEKDRYFAFIAREIDKINEFLTELATLAKPEKEEPKPTAVHEVLESVLTLTSSKLQLNGISVKTQYEKDLPKGLLCKKPLTQAFLNIVANAVQAMPNGGELLIRAEHLPDKAAIRIAFSDTGVGMSEETLRQIFNPFFTTRERGIGLGMSVTHQIITEVHHGEISVESELHKGTTVYVELPAATADLATATSR
ncbi:MAG: ATP-binding protein [Syntrophothermus sp.]